MSLSIPVVGIDPGPQYALDINACLTVIDGHNHTPGYGVPITPSGLNINTDLPLNNNNATSVRSIRFQAQASALSAPDLGSLYTVTDVTDGADLWYTDGVGNQVRITSGGLVNATSSGISSGTATASFVAGVLVVDAVTSNNTPANIKGGSLLLGNNVANSHYLTLSPPNSMASDYALVLPSIPASTLFMTLDTSGNMGTSSSVQGTQIATGSLTGAQLANQTITATQIANQTITATQIANNTITRAQEAAVGQSVSGSSGNYGSPSATPTVVISTTITTTGRPVIVSLQGDSSNNLQYYGSVSTGLSQNPTDFALFQIQRDGGVQPFATPVYASTFNSVNYVANPGFSFLDTPSAGSHTYNVLVSAVTAAGDLSALLQFMVLVVYEL